MKYLLLATVLFWNLNFYAQSQVSTTDDKPFIQVTGTAEKEVVPDIIYITIILKDKVTGKAEYTISEQEDKLKKALQVLNIDMKNLSLQLAASDIVKEKQKEKGVEEEKQFQLKLSTATEVSKVFKALHDNNIKEAYVSGTDHTQIEALRKEVRINAIKAAKDKATYLLQAVGEEPGKVLIIREEQEFDDYNNYRSNAVLSNFRQQDKNPYGTDSETDFKTITIKFSYFVKYAIK
jgi:uncharacterized protein YggE